MSCFSNMLLLSCLYLYSFSFTFPCHLSFFFPTAPSGTVQNLSAVQEGLNIYLSWINVHEEEHRGFIEGYNVYYGYDGGDAQKVVISGK